MKAPIASLKKKEIVWLSTHHCKHGHDYLSHYSCYINDNPQREKVGFIDIESSNLDANFGIMLSYCIKDSQSKKIYTGTINKKDIEKYEANKSDYRIVSECVENMLKFDRVVAHYAMFDIPFIRTRALVCGVDFPTYGSIYVDDTWRWAKNKLKLNSNRLEMVVNTLFGNSEKTHLDSRYWIGGTRGDKKSLDYILSHNKIDVLELEKVYNKLVGFVRKKDTSI
jgi:uncharacterized protein YprB with RNaseH-like and TPR domain